MGITQFLVLELGICIVFTVPEITTTIANQVFVFQVFAVDAGQLSLFSGYRCLAGFLWLDVGFRFWFSRFRRRVDRFAPHRHHIAGPDRNQVLMSGGIVAVFSLEQVCQLLLAHFALRG